MRGRPLHIEWQDDERELFQHYREQKNTGVRTRLHALWLVRTGHSLRESAKLVGVDERSVARWAGWYRQGGLAAVEGHVLGAGNGSPGRLIPEQRERLREQASQGAFHTLDEARQWVEDTYGVHYAYFGIRSLFVRMHLKKKVPRPIAAKAPVEAQEAWKKGAWQPT